MTSQRSLRRRLVTLLIPPLIIVAAVAAALRYQSAERTTEALYDSTLLAVAHVISRDVTLSKGDVLTEELLESLTSALGDQIFYHVRGPRGEFVTGYTGPPAPPPGAGLVPGQPRFFDSVYSGKPIRVVALREFISAPGPGGWTTVTVWQTVRQRDRTSLAVALRGGAMMLTLIASAGLVVWFGVNLGLRPLTDLRDAVARRSPDDLTPIRRPVPREARDLVSAMNALFGRLEQAFAQRDALISSTAHQLRNPIAAILAQAEAASGARDEAALRARLAVVAEAARRAARLTRQLLSMEKAKGRDGAGFAPLDLEALARDVAEARAPDALKRGGEVSFESAGAGPAGVSVRGDALMLSEAIDNLIDNALRYGEGAPIRVKVAVEAALARVIVEDDGPGAPAALGEALFERFRRGAEGTGVEADDGCGLGLAIVREIAQAHGGEAIHRPVERGARFEIALPLAS